MASKTHRHDAQLFRIESKLVWSVSPLRVGLFCLCWFGAIGASVLIAGLIGWSVLGATNLLGNATKVSAKVSSTGPTSLDGASLFWHAAAGAAALVVALSAIAVGLTVLFNMTNQLTGGLHLRAAELERAITSQPTDGQSPAPTPQP